MKRRTCRVPSTLIQSIEVVSGRQSRKYFQSRRQALGSLSEAEIDFRIGADPVRPQFLIKRCPVDPQDLCGFRLVSADLAKGILEHLSFRLGKNAAKISRALGATR